MEFILGVLIGAITAILGYIALDDFLEAKEKRMKMLMHTAVIIANHIHKFVESWVEGESYYLTIHLNELFLDDYENLEDEIDSILLNLDVVESFEIKCNELILEINMYILQQSFDQRMSEWKKEKESTQEDYYGRRAI